MKKSRKIIFRLTLLLLFFGAVFYFHKTLVRFGYRAYRDVYWRNFPESTIPGRIDVPGNYTVHGIDISRWQSDVDWKHLTALDNDGDTIAMTFAFIKATEGILWEDPMFDDNWTDAKKAGVIRGAYHYFKPNASATLQAKNFISSVKLKTGDLPPVIDVEEKGNKSKKELIAALQIYLAQIETHYHTKPIIYSNISFIENYLVDDFSDYKFWIAHS